MEFRVGSNMKSCKLAVYLRSKMYFRLLLVEILFMFVSDAAPHLAKTYVSVCINGTSIIFCDGR